MAFKSHDAPKDLTDGVKNSTTRYGESVDGCEGADRVGNFHQGEGLGPTKGYNPDQNGG